MNGIGVRCGFVLLWFSAASTLTADESGALDDIAATIDGFHAAAARGDETAYLGFLTEDGVFLGTDEWERWPKNPTFSDYVNGRFANGSGWTYTSVERHVRLAEGGDTAWFDEVIASSTDARFRGTGVLVKRDGHWKIAHYAMSFLVYNEIWEDVIRMNEQTRQHKESRGDEN